MRLKALAKSPISSLDFRLIRPVKFPLPYCFAASVRARIGRLGIDKLTLYRAEKWVFGATDNSKQ